MKLLTALREKGLCLTLLLGEGPVRPPAVALGGVLLPGAKYGWP